MLAPLPATRFELAEHRTATVQFNYHIAVDKMYYSVPFQYIREKVDVRVTDKIIEIFKDNQRIASHRRLHGRPGQYSTVTQHMPPDHQKYLEWNGDRFRKWAETVGMSTYKVIDSLLESGQVEQQYFRACMGILKLAEKKGAEKLEAACAKALQYTSSPSYKNIKDILSNEKVLMQTEANPVQAQDNSNQYGITRGAHHYGGNR